MAVLLLIPSVALLPGRASPASDHPVTMGLVRPVPGMDAPPFDLRDLDGKRRRLKDYEGKVVFVHFWATWCVPCRQELPSVQRLRDRFRDRDFAVVTIAADSAKAVRAFLAELRLDLPVLLDQYGAALRAYRIVGLPTTYIANRAGKVEGIAMGAREWDSPELTAFFESILTPPRKP